MASNTTADDQIVAKLAAAGLRPTAARRAILQTLEARKDHPTADELVARVNSGHRIGRATVYQNLEKLTNAGVIRIVYSDDGLRRYDSTLTAHQHMVCADGRVLDVQVDPKLLKQLRPLDPATGKPIRNFKLSEIRIEFHTRQG